MDDGGTPSRFDSTCALTSHKIPCYPKSSRQAYRFAQRRSRSGHSRRAGSLRRSKAPGALVKSGRSRKRSAGWVSVLDRFVANFTNRLDSKGRVSIPASFRNVLAKDGFEGLYVHPSLDQQALDCGGHGLLAQIDGLLGNFRPYTPEHDVYSLALMGVSETLKMDAEGRIILTDSLKSFAGITSEVTFVGQGYKFQVWEPARFRAHLEEARNQVRDLRKQLGARHLGAGSGESRDQTRPQPRGDQE